MTTIRFLTPPPGLGADTFTLAAVPDAPGLHTLRSTGADETRLFLLDAGLLLPAYTPDIAPETLEALGAGPLDVYIVVSPRKPEATLNLLAPILVDPEAGIGLQVILDDREWPVRAPLAVLAS